LTTPWPRFSCARHAADWIGGAASPCPAHATHWCASSGAQTNWSDSDDLAMLFRHPQVAILSQAHMCRTKISDLRRKLQ
jgi:hypothetical protein